MNGTSNKSNVSSIDSFAKQNAERQKFETKWLGGTFQSTKSGIIGNGSFNYNMNDVKPASRHTFTTETENPIPFGVLRNKIISSKFESDKLQGKLPYDEDRKSYARNSFKIRRNTENNDNTANEKLKFLNRIYLDHKNTSNKNLNSNKNSQTNNVNNHFQIPEAEFESINIHKNLNKNLIDKLKANQNEELVDLKKARNVERLKAIRNINDLKSSMNTYKVKSSRVFKDNVDGAPLCNVQKNLNNKLYFLHKLKGHHDSRVVNNEEKKTLENHHSQGSSEAALNSSELDSYDCKPSEKRDSDDLSRKSNQMDYLFGPSRDQEDFFYKFNSFLSEIPSYSHAMSIQDHDADEMSKPKISSNKLRDFQDESSVNVNKRNNYNLESLRTLQSQQHRISNDKYHRFKNDTSSNFNKNKNNLQALKILNSQRKGMSLERLKYFKDKAKLNINEKINTNFEAVRILKSNHQRMALDKLNRFRTEASANFNRENNNLEEVRSIKSSKQRITLDQLSKINHEASLNYNEKNDHDFKTLRMLKKEKDLIALGKLNKFQHETSTNFRRNNNLEAIKVYQSDQQKISLDKLNQSNVEMLANYNKKNNYNLEALKSFKGKQRQLSLDKLNKFLEDASSNFHTKNNYHLQELKRLKSKKHRLTLDKLSKSQAKVLLDYNKKNTNTFEALKTLKHKQQKISFDKLNRLHAVSTIFSKKNNNLETLKLMKNKRELSFIELQRALKEMPHSFNKISVNALDQLNALRNRGNQKSHNEMNKPPFRTTLYFNSLESKKDFESSIGNKIRPLNQKSLDTQSSNKFENGNNSFAPDAANESSERILEKINYEIYNLDTQDVQNIRTKENSNLARPWVRNFKNKFHQKENGINKKKYETQPKWPLKQNKKIQKVIIPRSQIRSKEDKHFGSKKKDKKMSAKENKFFGSSRKKDHSIPLEKKRSRIYIIKPPRKQHIFGASKHLSSDESSLENKSSDDSFFEVVLSKKVTNGNTHRNHSDDYATKVISKLNEIDSLEDSFYENEVAIRPEHIFRDVPNDKKVSDGGYLSNVFYKLNEIDSNDNSLYESEIVLKSENIFKKDRRDQQSQTMSKGEMESSEHQNSESDLNSSSYSNSDSSYEIDSVSISATSEKENKNCCCTYNGCSICGRTCGQQPQITISPQSQFVSSEPVQGYLYFSPACC